MTRLALFCDVYGNAAALRSALDAIEILNPDHVFVLGDSSGRGPKGTRVLEQIGGLVVSPSERRRINGSTVAFAQRSELGPKFPGREATDEELLRLVESRDAHILVIVGAQESFVRALGPRLVVAVSSLGLPEHGDPRAPWVMVDIDERQPPGAQVVRVPYKLERNARAMRKLIENERIAPHLGHEYLAMLLGTPGQVPDHDEPLRPDLLGSELLVRLLGRRIHRAYGLAVASWPGDDVEYVHQLRVAARRLREALGIAAPLLGSEAFREADRRTQNLGRVLGGRRSLDVFIEEIKSHESFATSEHLRAFVSFLDTERHTAMTTIHRKLPRERLIRHGVSLMAITMKSQRPTMRLRDFVSDHLSTRVDKVEARLASMDQPEDGDGHHRLRIALKHLRYSAEILESAYPELLAKADVVSPIKDVQEALGVLNDAKELCTWVGAYEASHPETIGPSPLASFTQAIEDKREARFQNAQRLVRERVPGVLDRMRHAAQVSK